MSTSREARQTIELDMGRGEPVPAILRVPESAAPVPAVLLLHGFNAHKDQLASTVGPALSRRGVASIAIDLPLHGNRGGYRLELARQNPLSLVRTWRLALREADAALAYLAARVEIDPTRLAIGGYSLGAYLGLFVAAKNPAARAVALVAGGDLPNGVPMESLVRSVVNPLRAVRALDGRPLLMVNGRGDRTITPALATALYEAADEPKELRWYAGGHWPPPRVIDDAAEWLASTLGGSGVVRETRSA
jgi:fermentation-respiration switch protein FrsA (DUF1100 family)